jgi:acetate kinase
MAFLILNAGSSSLKFSVIDHQDGRVHASGGFDASGPTNDAAVRRIVADIGSLEPPAALDAAVHRVVHGGSRFTAPVLVTAEVRRALDDLNDLAPLHNPPGLAMLDAALELLPDVPHVAVSGSGKSFVRPPAPPSPGPLSSASGCLVSAAVAHDSKVPGGRSGHHEVLPRPHHEDQPARRGS